MRSRMSQAHPPNTTEGHHASTRLERTDAQIVRSFLGRYSVGVQRRRPAWLSPLVQRGGLVNLLSRGG